MASFVRVSQMKNIYCILSIVNNEAAAQGEKAESLPLLVEAFGN